VILDGTGTEQNISFSLTGLTPGLEYYYRVTANNAFGTRSGGQMRFFSGAAFEPVALPGLPEVTAGSMVWGDYDNDGRLDFLLTGNYDNLAPETQLWRNTSNGFVNVTLAVAPGLPKVRGKAAWADYNNDGWLDFVISGLINPSPSGGSQPITQLWRNTGGAFVEESPKVATGFPMMLRPADLEWADYDNDGRLDLLLMGSVAGVPNVVFQIWRNTSGGFVNVTADLSPAFPSGVGSGNAAWGDYDKDGRLDLFLTGFTPEASRMSRIWRNTGSGFVDVTAAVAPGLPPLQNSAAAWGDYDGDGWLDFALAGDINGSVSTSVCQIWRNTGTGFSNETASVAVDLRGLRDGALAWGDYDNDGLLDLLLGGQNAGLTVARNNGTRFDNIRYQGLGQETVPLISASVAWGDYNNDGRLDILYSGSTGAENLTGLIRNLHAVPNSLPSAPTGLAMTTAGNAVMLSWDEATDGETPSAALTYNVRAGSSPGTSNLVSFQAAADGFRRVPAMGNAQLRRSFPLTGLANGQTVYWSVQAIDGSHAGGPLSAQSSEVSFPQMHIQVEGSNAIISWDPPTWGWPLEESEELEVWEQVSPGDANPFIIPLADPARFYRLVRP
jgi:hypothetical protein